MPQKKRETKLGRPTKYSSAVVRKICKAVAKGCSREAAAALGGISASTLHEWRNQFSEFSDGLEKADARFEAECVASIRKAGRGTRNWTANAWLLERKFPWHYGKTDRHEIRTQHERMVPLPEEYIKAISEALGVTGKLEPLDMRILPGESNGDDEIDLDILPQD